MAVAGAGPLALARAQRAEAARTLLETTELSIADVAFASGFDSVRQFNATVQEVFATTPRDLRAHALRSGRAWSASQHGANAAPRSTHHVEPTSLVRVTSLLTFERDSGRVEVVESVTMQPSASSSTRK